MNVLDTPEAKELLRQIELGLDAEAFLRTNFGGYLVERLIADRGDALVKLEEVDPDDAQAVRAAQNAAKIPLLVLSAINDCIAEYKIAEERLNAPPE